MTPARLFLLDTNVVVEYVRASELSKRIESPFNLRHQSERPLVSVVSIGELKALTLKLNWGAHKREALEKLLRELVVVDINSREVLEAYAEIDHWTEANGTRMGQQNDLWIAATARATSARLITTDKDFTVLDPAWIRHTYVSQQS